MKKFIAFVTIFIMLFSVCVFADTVINVNLDGKIIVFDEYPIIENGRTLVPLRKIFEELGATVSWDSSSKTAISQKNGTTVRVQIDNTDMYVNNTLKKLDVSAKLINGRTLVPARAIAEAYGCNVAWDEKNAVVTIKSAEYSEKERTFAKYFSATGYIISYCPDYNVQTERIADVSQTNFLLTDPDSLSVLSVTSVKNTNGATPANEEYLKENLENALGTTLSNYSFAHRNFMPSVSYEYYISGATANYTINQTVYFTNSYIYTVTLTLTPTVSETAKTNFKHTMYSLSV